MSPILPSAEDVRLRGALARLDALIDWERRDRAPMRVSIEPSLDLCARLGDPQHAFRCVHVAGSKGKGSTAALIAAGLARAGLRAGRYGSPHVERVNERVAIDGAAVSDERLAQGLVQALGAREQALAEGSPGAEATWFDAITAAAFWILRAERVEWAAIECGLGGRLDSTSVVTPEVCVITTIELEHVQILGGTLGAIAREKAGILKRRCALVSGVAEGSEAGEVIAARARELEIGVIRPGDRAAFEAASTQRRNALLAGLALDELGRRGHRGRDGRALSAARLDRLALESARLPARQEWFSVQGIPVVLDGAHTPESVRSLLADLAPEMARRGRPVAVLGLARDKDLDGILKLLAPRVDRLVCTSVGSERHRPPEEIERRAGASSVAAQSAATPRDALEIALELSRPRGWVLVLGSLYLAGALRPLLGGARPTHRC